MRSRADLQHLLEDIMYCDDGEVYFQPPEKFRIKYPCIIYKLRDYDPVYADNKAYLLHKRYQMLLIHRDPDNKIKDKLARLPMCTFERFYTADNLNHYVFNIYY